MLEGGWVRRQCGIGERVYVCNTVLGQHGSLDESVN